MAGRPPLWRVHCFSTGFHQNNLTTSQKRVWFSALNVQDYAEKAPAGLVLDSQTIVKVITAEDSKLELAALSLDIDGNRLSLQRDQ